MLDQAGDYAALIFQPLPLRHRFLQLYRIEIETHSVGLVPLITNWLDQPSDFNTVWDYTFGNVRRAVIEGASLPFVLQTVALLGLRLFVSGIGGHFQSECLEPVRTICGPFLLPPMKQLTVSGDGKSTTLHACADDFDFLIAMRLIDGQLHSEWAKPLVRTSLFQNDKALISLSFVESEGSLTGYDPG